MTQRSTSELDRTNSSQSNSDPELKWSCDYCTYLNWPSALRCTLCRARRPLQRIEELSPHREGGSRGEDNTTLLNSTGIQKWSCSGCTYWNWPRSRRCVQCGTDKPQTALSERNEDEPAVTPTPTNLKITLPPRSSESQGSSSPSQTLQRQQTSGCQSPRSFVLPSTSTTLDARIMAKKLQKWTCPACTFENWPKAVKCIMCYSSRPGLSVTPRPHAASPPLHSPPVHSREDTPSGSHSPTSSRENKRSLQGSESGGEGTGRKSPKNSAPPSSGSSTENLAVAAASTSLQEKESRLERHLRSLRSQSRHVDFLWLTAVRAVATSAFDSDPAEAYLAAGGPPGRILTHAEAQLLTGSLSGYHFEAGLTLIHLAIRYHREDLISLLLASADPENAPLRSSTTLPSTSQPGPGPAGVGLGGNRRLVKRVPCHVSPQTASDIRRQVAMSLRQRKGEFCCFFFTDLTTFSLPTSVYDLSPSVQQRVFDELLDRPVQKELEEENCCINWSLDVTDRLGSRLFALWNRTAGDCLLDSVLQATWGVFDSENSLRQALSDSLSDAAHVFYPRWREYETVLADNLQFSLDETQFARDWDLILQLASKPGSALEQAHIFALAHIVRRPIVVYGVRIVKSYRGEHLDYARFEGIYLPLLWEPSFCWRSPICLGYTRGHFSALVPMEPSGTEHGAIGRNRDSQPSSSRYAYLPLQDADGKMLPVHFLMRNETGHEQSIMRTWMDIHVTDGGVVCSKMKIHRPPPSVQQMIDDWLDHYRRLNQNLASGSSRRTEGVSLHLSPTQSSEETFSKTASFQEEEEEEEESGNGKNVLNLEENEAERHGLGPLEESSSESEGEEEE